MNAIKFEKKIKSLLRGCSEENTKNWVNWAKECVKAGQYANFVECPEEEAISAWLDLYYASIYFIKEEFGVDTAKKLVDLSACSLCLYPYEMKTAAKLLYENEKVPEGELLKKLQDGLLVRDEKPPTMEDVKMDLRKKGNRER